MCDEETVSKEQMEAAVRQGVSGHHVVREHGTLVRAIYQAA